MITLIDKASKVVVVSTTGNFMPSLIYKSQLNRISHHISGNPADDYLILYFSNDRIIINYLFIEQAQRTELSINSNADLMNYFDSIT